MPPPYYRGCWHGVSRGFLCLYRQISRILPLRLSSRLTELYNPKTFIAHAASHCHAFAHCKRFSTAASRRSLGSVSVPVWLTILSDQLPVKCLGRPLPHQQADRTRAHLKVPGPVGVPGFNLSSNIEVWSYPVLASLSAGYSEPYGKLPTCYSPFCHYLHYSRSFDLHA